MQLASEINNEAKKISVTLDKTEANRIFSKRLLQKMFKLSNNIEIQRAENKHKFRSIVYLIMALLNLCVSVVFCQWWGAVGSALGTAISLVVANGFIMNWYYQKACNIDVVEFWKNVLNVTKGFIVPILFGIYILLFVKFDSFLKLIGWIVGYGFVYCISIWVLSMNSYEKNLVVRPVEQIAEKIHKKLF